MVFDFLTPPPLTSSAPKKSVVTRLLVFLDNHSMRSVEQRCTLCMYNQLLLYFSQAM